MSAGLASTAKLQQESRLSIACNSVHEHANSIERQTARVNELIVKLGGEHDTAPTGSTVEEAPSPGLMGELEQGHRRVSRSINELNDALNRLDAIGL